MPFKCICYVSGNGIVGKFICSKITMTNNYREFSDEYNEKEKLICLTENDILAYAKGKNIHI